MKRFLIFFGLLFTNIFGVSAQGETPLMMVVNGTLYRLDGAALVPYTECQPPQTIVSTPVISSDNDHFVMRVLPPIVTDNLEALAGYGGEFPSDIWLCDHTTNTLTPLANQAPNTSLMDGSVINDGVLRSQPVWSPDGTQVAWSEATPEPTIYLLGVFDILSQSLVVNPLERLPLQNTVTAPEIFWSDFGVHVISYTMRESVLDTAVYTYESSGRYLADVFLMTQSDPTNFIVEYKFVDADATPYILVNFSDSGWSLVHLLTGQFFPIEVPSLALEAVNGSDDLNTLDYSTLDTTTNIWTTLYWLDENATPDSFLAYGIPQLAFAPDGTRLAYLDNQLHLWDLGDTGNIPDTLLANTDIASIVWGATEWVLDTDELQPLLVQCEGVLASRLVLGDIGNLSGTTNANNVRSAPNTNGNIVGKLTSNMTFTTDVGPICTESYAWYKIVVDGQFNGWTVEATPTEYWLVSQE